MEKALILAALGKLQTGDFLGLESDLANLIARHPAAALPRYLMAINAIGMGNTERAECNFAACLVRDTNLEIARFQLGLLYATQQRVDEALASWAPLVNSGQTAYLQKFAEGFSAAILGEHILAQQQISRGIELNLENSPLNADMKNVLQQLTAVPVESQMYNQAHYLISSYGHG